VRLFWLTTLSQNHGIKAAAASLAWDWSNNAPSALVTSRRDFSAGILDRFRIEVLIIIDVDMATNCRMTLTERSGRGVLDDCGWKDSMQRKW
jgi:hypothetical protein